MRRKVPDFQADAAKDAQIDMRVPQRLLDAVKDVRAGGVPYERIIREVLGRGSRETSGNAA